MFVLTEQELEQIVHQRIKDALVDVRATHKRAMDTMRASRTRARRDADLWRKRAQRR